MLRLYQTPSYELHWEPKHGTISLVSPGRAIEGLPGIEFISRGKLRQLIGSDLVSGRLSQETLRDAHGRGQLIHIHYLAVSGIAVILRLRMYQTRPFVLLQVSVTNVGREPINIQRLFFQSTSDGFQPVSTPTDFYSSGWRSNSPAGSVSAYNRDNVPDDASIWGLNPVYRDRQKHRFAYKGVHLSNLAGAVITSTEAFIGGCVTTADQFVQFVADCRSLPCQIVIQSQADDVPLVVGASISSEWFYLEWVPLPNDDPFSQYVNALQRQLQLGKIRTLPVSWHACAVDGTTNREEIFVDGLANAASSVLELPIESIVIYEDGLCDGVKSLREGLDDHKRNDFQYDFAEISKRVEYSGFLPGYAFAPLVVYPFSQVYRNHKNWLLKNERGHLHALKLGNIEIYCLDASHPEALEYLAFQIMTIVNQWHYRSLHLLHMHLASLPGVRYNPRMTRAHILHRVYEIIRENAGDNVYLTAYQSELGPAIGLVDALGTTAGSLSILTDQKRSKGTKLPAMSSDGGLMEVIQNMLNRAWMNGHLWINDPGIFFISDEHPQITERRLLTYISLLGLSGSVLGFAGRLSALPVAWQNLFSVLTPLLIDGLDVVDIFTSPHPDLLVVKMARAWGRWQLVCLINWSDDYVERVLPASLNLDTVMEYHLVDFWDQRYFRITHHNWPVIHLDPYSSVLLSIRPVVLDKSHLVATTFHITQGGEITEMISNGETLSLHIELQRVAQGSVWLALPAKPDKVLLNGVNLEASAVRTIASGVYEVSFLIQNSGHLEVFWGDN